MPGAVQVDDCLAKYQWMRHMMASLKQRRREGKPMPSSVDELESSLGNWRSYKQAHTQVQEPGTAGPGVQSAVWRLVRPP